MGRDEEIWGKDCEIFKPNRFLKWEEEESFNDLNSSSNQQSSRKSKSSKMKVVQPSPFIFSG